MKLPEIERLALEVAELAHREAILQAESERVIAELNEVSGAKATKLQQLAAGTNGSRRPSSGDDDTGTKERVYQLLVTNAPHVFTTREVIKSLKLNASTASSHLTALYRAKRISREGKGKYRALQPAQTAGRQTSLISRVVESVKASAAKGSIKDGALPARILALLDSEHAHAFTAMDIASRFGVSGETGTNAVRGALSRLSLDKRIEKVSHGKYRALQVVG